MLVELSINTRSVFVGDAHGAFSISKLKEQPSQYDGEDGRAVLFALSRAVPVRFPNLETVPSIGEDSSRAR